MAGGGGGLREGERAARDVAGDDVEVTAEDAWMPRLDPLKCSDSCGNGTKELGTVSWPLPPIVTLSAAWPPSWRP